MGKGGIPHVGRRADDTIVCGDGRDGVAMTHPHLRVGFKTSEQRVAGLILAQVGTPILASAGRFYLAPVGIADILCAIADAKHRVLADDAAQIGLERLRVVHGIRTAAENHSNDRGVIMGKLVVGNDLAEGVQLAHTAADELRGLRAEIKDDDLLLHNN